VFTVLTETIKKTTRNQEQPFSLFISMNINKFKHIANLKIKNFHIVVPAQGKVKF